MATASFTAISNGNIRLNIILDRLGNPTIEQV
jgi:hypothetical protein